MATLAITTDPADARSRRKRYVKKYQHNHSQQIQSSSRYAAIVVDAKTGKIAARGERRQPAPSGVADQDHDALPAVRAARSRQDQAPHADGGLRGGRVAGADQARACGRASTLEVEDAIKALVTKSANDASVVIAEALGGSEDAFAAQMTRKARALGMSHTVYRNASGLPERRAGHHGARAGAARHRDPGALPALLPLLLAVGLPSIAATPCATTTSCSAACTASTASRPATPAPPASISSPRSAAATATSWRWCWAAVRRPARRAHARA